MSNPWGCMESRMVIADKKIMEKGTVTSLDIWLHLGGFQMNSLFDFDCLSATGDEAGMERIDLYLLQ